MWKCTAKKTQTKTKNPAICLLLKITQIFFSSVTSVNSPVLLGVTWSLSKVPRQTDAWKLISHGKIILPHKQANPASKHTLLFSSYWETADAGVHLHQGRRSSVASSRMGLGPVAKAELCPRLGQRIASAPRAPAPTATRPQLPGFQHH